MAVSILILLLLLLYPIIIFKHSGMMKRGRVWFSSAISTKNYQENKKPGRGKHISSWLDLKIAHEEFSVFFQFS